MQYLNLGTSNLYASAVGLGCARMSQITLEEAQKIILTAIELGINMFDHADAYGNGESENIFAEAFKHLKVPRNQIILQSKVGIKNLDTPQQHYDHSKEHIISSVDGILKRLGTDYLDVLLLHRPDALSDPAEVAEAFSSLRSCGKVRYFGVSNYNRFQMELLSSYLSEKLIISQMQFNPAHTPMLDAGLNANMKNSESVMRDAGTIEYCMLNRLTMQTWSPFQFGLLEGVYLLDARYASLNNKLDEISKKYNTSKEGIVISWILRHPAQMQVLPGTMNPVRLKDLCQGVNIILEKAEWYEIYRSAGNFLP